MKQSQRWNTFQMCPCQYSNSGGSDLWSNLLPTRPWKRPIFIQSYSIDLYYPIHHHGYFINNYYQLITRTPVDHSFSSLCCMSSLDESVDSSRNSTFKQPYTCWPSSRMPCKPEISWEWGTAQKWLITLKSILKYS